MKLLIIFLLLSLTANSQVYNMYSINTRCCNTTGSFKDTLYYKTGISDTLYKKEGNIYTPANILKTINFYPYDSARNNIYNQIANRSLLSHNHAYNTLTGLPSLFDGNYNSLTNKPTIPTNTNQLTNGAGFLVAADIAGKQNNITLTTTGSGAATFVSNVLNIPTPAGGSGYSTVVLASDVTNSTTTIADVTGLSFPVTSGITYKFKFYIIYTAAAATTGSRWSINGPATTLLNYTSRYTLTATTQTTNFQAAYNVPAAANLSSLTPVNW